MSSLTGIVQNRAWPSTGSWSIVQLQLVQCAAAIVEASAAAVASVISDTEETVIPIEDDAVIGGRAILIRARCSIRCAESVQNLEITVTPGSRE